MSFVTGKLGYLKRVEGMKISVRERKGLNKLIG